MLVAIQVWRSRCSLAPSRKGSAVKVTGNRLSVIGYRSRSHVATAIRAKPGQSYRSPGSKMAQLTFLDGSG